MGVEAWEPGGVPAGLCQGSEPGPKPARSRLALTLRPVSPSCSTQAHGSRLRLYQVSPADSGEYVCRVPVSSGHQEASVLVTIEASGSSTVHVPGECPVQGWGTGGRGQQQAELGEGNALWHPESAAPLIPDLPPAHPCIPEKGAQPRQWFLSS